MLLTVEFADEIVEIHSDEEGLDLLIDRLLALRRHKIPEHDHLMTESWAGWELTEEKQSPDSKLINHLRVNFWPTGS